MNGKADMPPPDLRDPAQRRAYRRELMGVARAERYWGIFLAMVGVALLWMHRAGWLTFPEWLAPVVLGLGIALMLVGIWRRTRHHRRRMQE
jgi:hypothetical protein